MCTFAMTPGFTITNAWKEMKTSFLNMKPIATQLSWGQYKHGPDRKILEACRTRGTTVTGPLHGIIFAILLWGVR